MKFSKKAIQRTEKSSTIISIIGILILINFFSYQLFYRWDITQNKDFSISDVSKRTARQLDDLVNIKVYFSKNLPAELINLPQEVGDILDEYKNYSKGKVRVEFIDPADNEDLKRELQMLGIPEVQFQVFEKDKQQLVRGYLGMVIQYGDANEVIPVLRSTQNLEYQITLALKKLNAKEMPSIAFVNAYDCADLSQESEGLYRDLDKIYNIENIDLKNDIPSNIKTLIIFGPKQEIDEDALKKIDDFVMNGGFLLVLDDGVKVDGNLNASINNTGIDTLLEKYGVKINHNLVLDLRSGMVAFNQGFFTFSSNYPFWPKIIDDGFDKDEPAVSMLESVVLPWVSSLEFVGSDKDLQVKDLLKTTKYAWEQNAPFDLNPQQKFNQKNKGQKTLAMMIGGKLKSPYSEKSVDNARIIVVGDSDFATKRAAYQAPDNLVLFQNLVDSLSLDSDLIKIRSKSITDRPLKELSDNQKFLIRYLNIFGMTIVVIVFGMFRYYWRRKSGFVDEL